MTHSEPVALDTAKEFRFRTFLWQWFWRLVLVGSLAYAWYCFYVPANSIAWAADFAAAQQRAVADEKPMILYFTGEWCVPCRIMKREVWADDDVARVINERFVPVMIDIDDPDDKALLETYQVRGAPVAIVTDAVGNVVQWTAGATSKADFLTFVGAAAEGARESMQQSGQP